MSDKPHPPEGIVLTPEQRRKQRRRSVALAFCIAGLAVIFYVVTIVKMGPALFSRGL